MSETLETRGTWDFNGTLPRMTAHPKIDPVTGELLMFYYSGRRPELVFAIANPVGHVISRTMIDLPHPMMIHDFVVTERHAVFFCCPIVFDFEAAPGYPVLQWRPHLGTRIAVVRRDGSELRWFDAEPFFLLHFHNAYEENDTITVDFVRHPAFGRLSEGRLSRAIIERAGRVVISIIDDHNAEFPRVDPRTIGRKHLHGWMTMRTSAEASVGTFNALGHYDFAKARMNVHDFGPDRQVDEPVFVADPSRGKAAGWIIAYVYDRNLDASTAVIVDALDLGAPPVAEIVLPRRVPHGFHGNWF
jgi:carotenoid cleavage dioxygenase